MTEKQKWEERFPGKGKALMEVLRPFYDWKLELKPALPDLEERAKKAVSWREISGVRVFTEYYLDSSMYSLRASLLNSLEDSLMASAGVSLGLRSGFRSGLGSIFCSGLRSGLSSGLRSGIHSGLRYFTHVVLSLQTSR